MLSTKLLDLLLNISVINNTNSSFFWATTDEIFSNSLINNFIFVLALDTSNLNSSFKSLTIFLISDLTHVDNSKALFFNFEISFSTNPAICFKTVSKFVKFLNCSVIDLISSFIFSISPLCTDVTKLSKDVLKSLNLLESCSSTSSSSVVIAFLINSIVSIYFVEVI